MAPSPKATATAIGHRPTAPWGALTREWRGFTVPAPFLRALAAADIAGARRLAHNIQSQAANFGAQGVERAAAALELACAQDERAQRLHALPGDLSGQLLPVLDGLRRLIDTVSRCGHAPLRQVKAIGCGRH